MLGMDSSDNGRNGYHDYDRLTQGYGVLYDTCIYRDGITNIIYMLYKNKWHNVNDLDFDSLPLQFKRAAKDSEFDIKFN